MDQINKMEAATSKMYPSDGGRLPSMPWQEHTGLKFKDGPDESGWAMTRSERANIVTAIEENGPVSEDDIEEYAAQADMFGEASLTEHEQFVLHTGIGRIIAVESFMEDIGRPYDMESGTFGTPLDKMEPRDRTTEPDTGRYLQIEYDGKPVNVYEHVPDEGRMREFWGVDKDRPDIASLVLFEDEVKTLGVYEGKPFQAERDARAVFLNKSFELQREHMDADGPVMQDYGMDEPSGYMQAESGIEEHAPESSSLSVYEQMLAAKHAVDEREDEQLEFSDEFDEPQ